MQIIKELKKHSNKSKAKTLQRFFKTGKGEYGEGDIFIGVNIPTIRNIAKEHFQKLNLKNIQTLLNNKIHEVRMLGTIILTYKFEKSNNIQKETIYKFYIKNAKRFNNWDLVDLSSYKILGEYLTDRKDRKILYKLAKSKNLWEKRISIASCFSFIRKNEFNDCLKISKILLKDKHDLIHKAVGWMLREVGKRNKEILINFLKEHYKKMPKVCLRYALEKFDKITRDKYYKKLV